MRATRGAFSSASPNKGIRGAAIPENRGARTTKVLSPRLALLGKGLLAVDRPAASLRRFFDQAGAAGRVAALSPPAGGAAEAPAPSEDRARLKELRQVLGDGTRSENGWISPFFFHFPGGGGFSAETAGLEGFLLGKLRFEHRAGRAPSAAELRNYFAYLDSLLKPLAWAAPLRAELARIRAGSEKPAAEAKNEALNDWLLKTLNALRSELRRGDRSLKGRDSAVYMILARAYNRSRPGANFFDSLDAEELGRIRSETAADTVWLLDIFEIGEINRWGTGGGSPYAIKGYRVKEELGGEAAFKRFAARAHRLGLKVMTDYIPNHASLDSDMIRARPEAFLHLVPPQPEPGEDLAAYGRRVLDEAPKTSYGHPLYRLLRTDRYPDGNGGRGTKWILIHHPYADNFLWIDMAQIDYSHPEARAWQAAQARRLLGELGVDAVRRDMAYLEANDRFYPHWIGVLRWERDRAQGWVRQEVERLMGAFQRRWQALEGAEFLEEWTDAARDANPEAFAIDEVYGSQDTVSRTGSNGLYNKVDLYDAQRAQNIPWIEEALRRAAARIWQLGAAGSVNFVGTHDGGEGNPVDRFGRYVWAAVVNALAFRPVLMYNGLELMAGQGPMLLSDELHRSADLEKAIPFDIRVLIDWSSRRAEDSRRLTRILQAFARNRDLLRDGPPFEVLERTRAGRTVAWLAGRTDPQTGRQRAILAAASYGHQSGEAFERFRLGNPVYSALGAFLPRRDRIYLFRDVAGLDAEGRPPEHRYTGAHLLDHGLDVGLPGGGIHVFEIEEE